MVNITKTKRARKVIQNHSAETEFFKTKKKQKFNAKICCIHCLGGHHGHKKYHKKGHHTTGFHHKGHKDEHHKEHKFYDEEDKKGDHKKYGSEHEFHEHKKGDHKKGEKHDSGFDEGHHGTFPLTHSIQFASMNQNLS